MMNERPDDDVEAIAQGVAGALHGTARRPACKKQKVSIVRNHF